jgi:NADP-dependent 3-hydroxy acid dehydrogenase YdfG
VAFRRQGHGHLVTTVSTAGLKIVPTQAVYAATKNAVRTLLEGLRQESTDGVLRTTTVSPGFVRAELADSIDNPELREQTRRSRDEFAISPDAVARAITLPSSSLTTSRSATSPSARPSRAEAGMPGKEVAGP